MADGPNEQREVRAAEHHGIDTAVAQRFNRGADQRAHGRRIEDILVLEPLLLQMCARGELVLDHLDKARSRTAVYVDTGIQVLNGTRVSARANGEVGGKHAHATCARAVDCRTGARRDHADHGDVEHLLS